MSNKPFMHNAAFLDAIFTGQNPGLLSSEWSALDSFYDASHEDQARCIEASNLCSHISGPLMRAMKRVHSIQIRQSDFTRLNNSVDGNPRYCLHFLHLLTPQEREWRIDTLNKYSTACKRANRLGYRKYNTKAYGGGLSLSSYSLDEDIRHIYRLLAAAMA